MTDASVLDKTSVAADIFAEFFETAVHYILYARGLYPAGVFDKRKKYNVPVQQCLHPDVSNYVTNVADSIRLLLEKNDMEKVTMVILNAAQQPIERFVFEIDKPLAKSDDKFLFYLEQSLRAFLLKINVCDAILKPLPPDCTWTVHVHTKESAADRIEDQQILKGFPWIEADKYQTELQEPVMVPLKAVNTDVLKMQLYVEESSLKNKDS